MSASGEVLFKLLLFLPQSRYASSCERRPEGQSCGASRGRQRQQEWPHQVRLNFFFSSFSRIFICFVLCALFVSSCQQWKD